MAAVARNTFERTLKALTPKMDLPPVLKPRCGNLYEVLSRKPTGPVGMEVHQTRWSEKNIANSYWVITRATLKLQGKHGRAWGRLYWKGKPVSLKDERIRGSLKYSWKEGRSTAKQGLLTPKTTEATP